MVNSHSSCLQVLSTTVKGLTHASAKPPIPLTKNAPRAPVLSTTVKGSPLTLADLRRRKKSAHARDKSRSLSRSKSPHSLRTMQSLLPTPSISQSPDDKSLADDMTASDTDDDEANCVAPMKVSAQDIEKIRRTTNLSLQQTRRHLQLLHQLTENPMLLPHQAWQQLATVLTQRYTNLSTRITMGGSAIGAIKRIEVYRPFLQQPHAPVLSIGISKVFQDQLATWRQLMTTTADFDLPEVTPEAANQIMTALESTSTRGFFMILYRAAARMTSVLNIRSRDVFLNRHKSLAPHGSILLSIRFREGKTLRYTGPYTVHILMPSELALAIYQAKGTTYLFGDSRHRIAKTVSLTLHTHGLDVRACRRGSLRFLARSGADPDHLRLLSRHTSLSALYTYLGAGLHLRAEAIAMVNLSKLHISISSH